MLQAEGLSTSTLRGKVRDVPSVSDVKGINEVPLVNDGAMIIALELP